MRGWELPKESIAQASSWLFGGLFGGTMLMLVQSEFDPMSPGFWIIFAMLFLMATYLAHFVTNIRPDNGIEGSEMEELRDELGNLSEEIASLETRVPGSNTSNQSDDGHERESREKELVETEVE